MRKLCTFTLIVTFCLSSAIIAQTTYPGKIGVGGASWEFVNLADHSYRWAKSDGAGGWIDLTSSDVDSVGWPTSDCRWVFDNRPVAEWAGAIDDPEVYRKDYSGVYEGSFKGQATLTHIEGPWTISNQVYDSGTNTTTFNLTMDPPGPHHSLIVMSFTDTKRTSESPTGSGITDFRLIKPGYAWDTTQVFTDELINCYNTASFAVIRYLHVNGNTEWDAEGPLFQSWSNRKLSTDASQGGISPLNKKDLWCYEYYIELCNLTQKDFWLCVPIAADDDYLNQLAQLVYNNLDPGLNVYLENSNEVWNYGFNQYAWNKAMAEDEVNAAAADYDYDSIGDPEVWHYRRHANRTMDIVNAFANVFGANEVNNRLRGVLCWWAIHLDWLENYMVPYIQENYGPPSNYFYGIGLATYMGGNAASGGPGTETYTVNQILDDMRQTATNSIPTRQNWINAAANWNLAGGCFAYETGTDTGGGSTVNIANRIMAVRDPRMYTELKYNYEDCWLALGGGLTVDLSLAGQYSRYGCWGLTDDTAYPDRDYQMQVIRDLLGDSATEPPLPPTNLQATGGDSQVFLTWNASAGAQSYSVKRSETSGGAYTPVDTDITETSYTDTGLANGTTYYYVVTASNLIGESGNSNEASATPATDTTPPAAPTNLSAVAGDATVSLDWDDNAESDLAGYNVYRATVSGGSYDPIASLVLVSNYTDNSVTNDTTYYYVVTAEDASSNESGNSNEASATPTATPAQLLAWDFAGEGGAASSTADYTHADISTTSPSGVASIGSGLTPIDYIGDGLTATNQTAMTLADALAMDEYLNWSIAPELDLAMTITSVDIRPVSQNRIRTFTLFSSIGGFTQGDELGSFDENANFNAPIHTVNLSGHADLSTTVEFRLYVHGYDNSYEAVGMGNGDGDDLIVNGTIGGGTPTPPPAPANLEATPLDSQVDLLWDASPGADTYIVYRGTGGNYNPIASDIVPTSYSDTDVTNGTTYYYYVTAVNTYGESGSSNQVSAIPQAAPGQATNPNPGDGATGVSVDADLSWTAGAGANSHDIYFGTTSPGDFQGNQPGTTFDPGPLANDVTYYWRIDEVNAAGTTTGVVWSFTTVAAPPGQASNPSPADGASAIDVDADLSWTAGTGATSHDVYFGTVTTPPFVGNQTETTYDPGTMAEVTTYFWRIDEVNAGGTTEGVVWSFTTAAGPQPPGQATNPNPGDGATGVSVDADLSWTAGAGADSHDIYFGTDSTPDSGEFQGNQPGTTFDPGTLANDTTYYWRIDEVNANGTTTGVVWSFTTESAPQPPGQATNPSPADGATGVNRNVVILSWTAGTGATSHDVYFGTNPTPGAGEFQGNQTPTTFDPGRQAKATWYYWRIDEVNASGTTTGVVWSFQTK